MSLARVIPFPARPEPVDHQAIEERLAASVRQLSDRELRDLLYDLAAPGGVDVYMELLAAAGAPVTKQGARKR